MAKSISELMQTGVKTPSRIQVCIGSRDHLFQERKLKLMLDLQMKGIRVHCDYSDDMDSVITPEFIAFNNVAMII